MENTNGRPEEQDETTETTADDMVYVGTTHNSSRGAYHTDRDCHLLAQTSGPTHQKTRTQAIDVEGRDACSACAGEVDQPTDVDPLRTLRKLGYDSVNGGA